MIVVADTAMDRAHEKVRTCAAKGIAADFTRPDDPDELPDYNDEEFWAERTVDGNWLAVLLTADDELTHRRGVEIEGARLLDGLDLEAAELHRPLTLVSCQFGSHTAFLKEAKCRSINFIDIVCGGFHADGAEILGRLLFHSCTINGEVRLVGATVGVDLDCSASEFVNPSGYAFTADGAHIGGDVFFHKGCTARGMIRFVGATITGGLNFMTSAFVSPEGSALVADGAHIGGGIFLRDNFTTAGLVRLTHTSAGALSDDRQSWPERIDLDGFRYDRLYSTTRDWHDRAEWLRRQQEPSPQGYIQLAFVYRSCGDDRDARKILIERHNALLNPPEHWKSQLPRGFRGFFTKLWRWFLRLAIGHGYEPWRALWFAVPLIFFMSLWYADAKGDNALIPTGKDGVASSRCTSDYVCVQPVVYALDTLLPLVDFGQRSKWTPDQSNHTDPWLGDGRWLAAATWFTSALGWVLATLVAAGFTQAVRRE